MGREVKRVALDFEWPLRQTWGGYLNPNKGPDDCPSCEGTGYSEAARFLYRTWYQHGAQKVFGPFFGRSRTGVTNWTPDRLMAAGWGEEMVAAFDYFKIFGFETLTGWGDKLTEEDVAALVAADRLWDFTRDWSQETGWKPKDPPYVPTPEEVNAWDGHDAINRGVCVKARCERHGFDDICATCGGSGSEWESDEQKRAYESWVPHEPPEGPGYQIWETVSDGSPVSPVFTEPEDLASWMVDNDTSVTRGTTFEQWVKFIREVGWSPSMVSDGKGLRTGVEAFADFTEEEVS